MPRTDDLDVAQDLVFQQRSWVFQKVGWAVMGLLALAGLAGVFGGGPWSVAHVSSEDSSLRVEYGRFVRHSAPARLEIRLRGDAVQEQQVRLWISRDYLSGMHVENIVPEPTSVEAAEERVYYTFELSQQGEPAAITFDIQPDEIGREVGQVGIEDGASVEFTAIVYP